MPKIARKPGSEIADITDDAQRNYNRRQTAVVRALMIELDISRAEMARRCGMTPASFTMSLCRGVIHQLTRDKIEAALGYLPVWNDPATVEKREHALRVFGFDPCLVTTEELLAKSASIHADFSNCRHSKQLMCEEVYARASIFKRP